MQDFPPIILEHYQGQRYYASNKIIASKVMIHPDTRLVYINDVIGYGVFATAFIPKGTITYVKDALEVEVTPAEFSGHTPDMQELIEKYSFIDERGIRIISWDFGKYVNHCCHCNTMSTGYGFEIAIRDIYPDEEITDEYGLFNMGSPMTLCCKHADCRGIVCKEDLDNLHAEWDNCIKTALRLFNDIEQPLLSFLQKDVQQSVQQFLNDPSMYRSVYALKYLDPASNHLARNLQKIGR